MRETGSEFFSTVPFCSPTDSADMSGKAQFLFFTMFLSIMSLPSPSAFSLCLSPASRLPSKCCSINARPKVVMVESHIANKKTQSVSPPTSASMLESFVGRTPNVQLKRIASDLAHRRVTLIAKLEGNNPGGSVKDRPALSMVRRAEERGTIKPGDTLIEATSGNTGIALAMVAAMRGYRMILVMPENQSVERRQTMRAFGAELILTPAEGSMEMARDVAERLRDEGRGVILDQFANPDNWLAHYEATGPEIWESTGGRVTHFVSSMGTTGTIMGVSRYLKERNPDICIVGCQPTDGSQIPGIRKWSGAYMPKIFDLGRVDRIEEVSQEEAEDMTRRLAREEGIFAGISSGGAAAVALRLAQELEDATIVFIVCDRGDRYLSTAVFPS